MLLVVGGIFLPAHFAKADLAGIALDIFYPAIYAMGAAAQWIALTLLGWSGSLFDYILSPEFNQIPFTKSLFVKNGWIITRNFANSFFMLVMLAIAFSTILRIDIAGISIKKTLPRLVIAALLINFSLVIGGLIIDAGQIIMVTFTHGATSQGSLATFLQNEMRIGSLFAGPDFLEGLSGGKIENLKAISSVWFGALFIGLAAFAFFMLAIMLIVRIVILWLLLIFAPLAWLAYIIPGTEQFWKQWWDMFLKQTFFGAIIGFFMYLAAQMAANLSAIQQFSKEVGTDIETGSKFLSNTSFLLQYFTILVMLYLSIVAARRINNTGVNATFKVLGAARRVAMPAIKSGYGATGIPSALGQIGRMFTEEKKRRETRTGAFLSRPVGKLLSKIPTFKDAERVGMKELRDTLKKQWDDLSLGDLKEHAKNETGTRRQVALEMLLANRVRLTPREYIEMKTNITEQMAGAGETGKEAEITKSLLEGLKPTMKGGQYTKQEVTDVVTNKALLKEYLRNVEFFKDPAVKEILPNIITPEIMDEINENAGVRVQKEVMDALSKHKQKQPKPKIIIQ